MRVGDFRSILLYNSTCLIIAKVLANKVREVIDELVDPFQFKILFRATIEDSAVMAREIITEWKKSATKGFLWKVDFAKAYDSIDWKFL